MVNIHDVIHSLVRVRFFATSLGEPVLMVNIHVVIHSLVRVRYFATSLGEPV